jgi:hypothetical protein
MSSLSVPKIIRKPLPEHRMDLFACLCGDESEIFERKKKVGLF